MPFETNERILNESTRFLLYVVCHRWRLEIFSRRIKVLFMNIDEISAGSKRVVTPEEPSELFFSLFSYKYLQ